MEEENIITVSYEELNDDLKEQVRNNFREDDYLVPDDWYEWVNEGIKEKYPAAEIDDDIEFDMYRNDFKITGHIDPNHSSVTPLSEDFWKYYDKEWIYDFMTNFENDTVVEDYAIGEDIIYDELEEEIFGEGDKYGIEFDGDGKGEASVLLKSNLEKAIENYSDIADVSKLEEWIGHIDAVELFFQDTFEIDETDYDDLLEEIRTEMVRKLEGIAEEAYSQLSEYASNIYDDFVSSMTESYEYYFTDEYADDHLADRTFEVEVDEDGNQLEVVDLNGDW
jgi:hypothetical protein